MTTIRQFQPGVYNIDIDEYHSCNGLSRSGIMAFRKSPLHYWAEYRSGVKKEKEDTPAILLGKAVHSYVLEPDTFKDKYMVAEKVNRQSNAGKEKWNQLMQDLNGRTFLTQEMFDEVERIGQTFLTNDLTKQFIENGQIEKSLFWKDVTTNILLKCRPDIWHSNMICDIKTTTDASPREFQRDIMNYGYHIQAAMIQDAIETIYHKKISDFIFLSIEKKPPYATGIYILDHASIERGREEYREVLENYRKTEETQVWHSYKPTIISLPAYY